MDGNTIKPRFCADSGVSTDHRTENIRRIAETTKMMLESGTIVLTAFISACREDLERKRNINTPSNFLKYFVVRH